MMSRLSQLLKKRRTSNVIEAERQKPQNRGVCLKLTTMSPKKPNSANRRIAKINLIHFKKKLTVKIPGEGHNLVQHSIILVRNAGVRDLIGVQHVAIRGKYDLFGVVNRKTSKSKYGVKANTQSK